MTPDLPVGGFYGTHGTLSGKQVHSMKNGFYTVAEAAEALCVSKTTLTRRIEAGEITPDKVDRKTGYRYFTQQAINRHIAERYWQAEHLQRPESNTTPAFTFIDLFAGIGGIRLGFEAAGGECLFSSEIDKYAVKTYEHVFRNRSEHEPAGDITQIDATSVPAHDILCGGFPCQPFSIAGVSKYESLGWKHGFQHPAKGTLFFDVVRILAHHRPKAFFLENVKNLKSHDKGKTWAVIEKTLRDMGYDVHARILDAQLVVPQHRERIFIVGFRSDLCINFTFPDIEQQKPKLRDILEKDPVDSKYTLTDHLWKYLQDYAERHRAKGNGFGFGLADLDGVTRTLSARYHKDGSEILIPQAGKNPRRLTPAECARLQGFPEPWWYPVVSDTQAYRQFGNAVAVPLIEIVAKQMIRCMATAGVCATSEMCQ